MSNVVGLGPCFTGIVEAAGGARPMRPESRAEDVESWLRTTAPRRDWLSALSASARSRLRQSAGKKVLARGGARGG